MLTNARRFFSIGRRLHGGTVEYDPGSEIERVTHGHAGHENVVVDLEMADQANAAGRACNARRS